MTKFGLKLLNIYTVKCDENYENWGGYMLFDGKILLVNDIKWDGVEGPESSQISNSPLRDHGVHLKILQLSPVARLRRVKARFFAGSRVSPTIEVLRIIGYILSKLHQRHIFGICRTQQTCPQACAGSLPPRGQRSSGSVSVF